MEMLYDSIELPYSGACKNSHNVISIIDVNHRRVSQVVVDVGQQVVVRNYDTVPQRLGSREFI